MNHGRKTGYRKTEGLQNVDENDGDEKDECKRKMRNLSEKKRRDQFNMLINELCSMVSINNRKMDKSTVLKSTIAFLRNQNGLGIICMKEIIVHSDVPEIQEVWKPTFLSNEEFAHLMLEALDGFIMMFSMSGKILYVSENIASLLGHLPIGILNMTIYDLIHDESKSELHHVLSSYSKMMLNGSGSDSQVSFLCYMKHGPLDSLHPTTYELVKFIGMYRQRGSSEAVADDPLEAEHGRELQYCSAALDLHPAFIAIARLQTPQLLREMWLCDATTYEFTSRHSLEWKFLFLDHRASPIIGYLPFEVLGTSGYDYYHADDLDRVSECHEALMQTGEGTSCYFRFLTKGQQWIWLQSQYYITYHQWNSKPEFIVCTHRVVSYAEAKAHLRTDGETKNNKSQATVQTCCLQAMKRQQEPTNSGIPFQGITKNTNEKIHNKERVVQTPNTTSATSKSAEDQSPSIGSSRQTTHQNSSFCHNATSQTSKDTVESTAQNTISHPIQQTNGPRTLLMSDHHFTESCGMNSVVLSTAYQPVFALPAPPPAQWQDCETTRSSEKMTPQQTQLQELRRKHQVLKEQIRRNQEELKKVHEQILVSQLIASTTSGTTYTTSTESNMTTPRPALKVHSQPHSITSVKPTPMTSNQLVVSTANLCQKDSQQPEQMAQLEDMPLQISQHHTQIIFTSQLTEAHPSDYRMRYSNNTNQC